MLVRTAQCRTSAFLCVLPQRWASTSTAVRSRPDILQCTKCSLFKFGDPTSEPHKALFKDLTWYIRDEILQKDKAARQDKAEAWALIGPRANLLIDSTLLGKSRSDPPNSRKWPLITEKFNNKPIEELIKKVSFNTRLESNSYLSTPGEFTDYTSRYYGIRKDDEDSITLKQHLKKYAKNEGLKENEEEKIINDTAQMLNLDHLLDIPLIALSNGQTRRARIARALLTKPEVLVLEEPFTGLDASSRKSIADLLGKLHETRSPRIVLILRPQDTIPNWVDNIVEMDSTQSQEPRYIGPIEIWKSSNSKMADKVKSSSSSSTNTKAKKAAKGAPEIFTLEKANVKYQDRHILKDITWQLKAGDRAVLTGANGSGKSTLLSLILGDHPASYTQNLSLFGQPRSKHSIYSLSQKIGHYSPELFSSFPRKHGDAGLSLYEVIGTGFENIFTYRKLTEDQKLQIDNLIQRFDPHERFLNEKTLHKMLFVEAEPSLQALSLILRASIKKPDLLVLDEPFAGMNDELIQHCKDYLDNKLEDKQTLIFISHYEQEWPNSIGKRMHLEEGVGKAMDV